MASCRVLCWSVLVLAGLTAVAGAGCDWMGMMKCAVEAKGYLRVEFGETAQVMASMDVKQRMFFCRNFSAIFKNCINPKRGGCPSAVETLLDAVQNAGEYACDDHGHVSGLHECVSEPELRRRVFECNREAFSNAYRFIARYDEVLACRVGNELLGCVDNAMRAAGCEPSAARWIREINNRIFEPFADDIDCDVIEVPAWMEAHEQKPPSTTPESYFAKCFGARHSLRFVLLVALPVLGLLVFIVTLVCCCHRRRRRAARDNQAQEVEKPKMAAGDGVVLTKKKKVPTATLR